MLDLLKGMWPRSQKGGTMELRCPNCYQKVEENVFNHPAGFRCVRFDKASETKEEADYFETQKETVFKHYPITEQLPTDPSLLLKENLPIATAYLDVATKFPKRVISVTISGISQTGKSMMIAGLSGISYYPSGNSYLTKAFPKDFFFDKTWCEMRNIDANSMLQVLEDMWVEGDVPERTKVSEYWNLFKIPVIYSIKKGKLVLIINDFPGEVARNPQEIAKQERFPHLACTTDLIFVHPAANYKTAANELETFTKGLTINTFEGSHLEPKTINLVFALTQIDRLIGDKNTELKKLLKICLTDPYTLPNRNKEADLKRYFEGMKTVDEKIREWFDEYANELLKKTEGYRTVKFCALSSVGSNLVQQGRKDNSESYLIFEPSPVRVADPLFWIFKEHGLLQF